MTNYHEQQTIIQFQCWFHVYRLSFLRCWQIHSTVDVICVVSPEACLLLLVLRDSRSC